MTQNGFLFTIEAKEFLEDKPLGTYTFDEDSDFKIRLQKYIGPVKASPLRLLKDAEWLNYPCEGSITITQHLSTHSLGSFQLNAFDENGEIVYQLGDGYFEIAN